MPKPRPPAGRHDPAVSRSLGVKDLEAETPERPHSLRLFWTPTLFDLVAELRLVYLYTVQSTP